MSEEKSVLKTTTVRVGQKPIFKLTGTVQSQTKVWFCVKCGFWSPGAKPQKDACPTCGAELKETVA